MMKISEKTPDLTLVFNYSPLGWVMTLHYSPEGDSRLEYYTGTYLRPGYGSRGRQF
jgi:hypothetical protein